MPTDPSWFVMVERIGVPALLLILVILRVEKRLLAVESSIVKLTLIVAAANGITVPITDPIEKIATPIEFEKRRKAAQ